MTILLDKQSFIARVNAWAKAHRAPAVNARMLEDWNEEAVFPTAFSVPCDYNAVPKWRYGYSHYRRALVICRFKRKGISRYSAIRTMLWLFGMEPHPPVGDLALEWLRQSKQLLAGISSIFDPAHADIGGRKADTLVRQMGPLSPLLDVEGIRPSRELLLDGYQAARFDRPHQDLVPILKHLLSRLFGENPLITDWNIPPLTNLMSGLTGPADEIENSGETLIWDSGPEALNKARLLVSLFVNSMRQGIFILKSLNVAKPEIIDELSPPFLAAARAAKLDPRWRIAMLWFALKLEETPLGDIPVLPVRDGLNTA